MEPPQFKVELVKLPPQIPVEIVEPGLTGSTEIPLQLPVELTEPVLPHLLVASGALVLGIYGNPLPQILEIPMN